MSHGDYFCFSFFSIAYSIIPSFLAARKHVIDDAIDGRPEPGEGEAVVKILQADGGYIYRVQVTLG